MSEFIITVTIPLSEYNKLLTPDRSKLDNATNIVEDAISNVRKNIATLPEPSIRVFEEQSKLEFLTKVLNALR